MLIFFACTCPSASQRFSHSFRPAHLNFLSHSASAFPVCRVYFLFGFALFVQNRVINTQLSRKIFTSSSSRNKTILLQVIFAFSLSALVLMTPQGGKKRLTSHPLFFPLGLSHIIPQAISLLTRLMAIFDLSLS